MLLIPLKETQMTGRHHPAQLFLFDRDKEHGYGNMTHFQMCDLLARAKWRDTAANSLLDDATQILTKL